MAINRDIYKTGRLTVRPGTGTPASKVKSGVQPLQLGKQKDGLLYVPAGYHHDRPASLTVMLHGSGGQAEHGLSLLRQYADSHNIILVAPASRSYSWDIIASDAFDLDVIFIDQALAMVFERFAIDPAHVAIGGFSDGASYALCVGLTNGDLFTHILAFSPGFAFTRERAGKPAVFISHGEDDPVLPIDTCSRRIKAQLQRQEYNLSYHEFGDGHTVPPFIAQKGVEWFINSQG